MRRVRAGEMQPRRVEQRPDVAGNAPKLEGESRRSRSSSDSETDETRAGDINDEVVEEEAEKKVRVRVVSSHQEKKSWTGLLKWFSCRQ